MARFERSRDGNRGSRGGDNFRGRGNDNFRGRDSGRGDRNDRPRFEMTKVICSDCGVDCEVPFKPTSDKPVYCSDCFEKQGKGGSRGGNSSKDFEIINEKLDKIMVALKIK